MFKVLVGAALVWAGLAGSPSSAVGTQGPPQPQVERLEHLLSLVRDRLWVESDGFWHQGEYRRCIAAMQLIAEIDPHDVEAFSSAAWLLWNVGDEDAAVAYYRKGISLNPDKYDLYYDLGMHYFTLHRYADAVEALEPGLQLGPPAIYWKLLAHCYEHTGRFEDALLAWKRVKELAPDDPVVDRMLEAAREKAKQIPVDSGR